MEDLRTKIENGFYENYDYYFNKLEDLSGVVIINIGKDSIKLRLSDPKDASFLINLLYNSEIHRLDFCTDSWDEIIEPCYESDCWYSESQEPIIIFGRRYSPMEFLYAVDKDLYTTGVREYMYNRAMEILFELMRSGKSELSNLWITNEEAMDTTLLYYENYIEE